MIEKAGVAFAKVVVAWLAIVRSGKTVFRATAVAGETESTSEALRGQAGDLVVAKFLQLIGPDHVAQMRFGHPANVILQISPMVARIETVVMLKCQAADTGFGKDAKQ